MHTILRTSLSSSPRAQRGVATLLITLVILTTITFTLIYSARAILMERNITANDLRGRQAFEAAEAGQEAAVAYLTSPGGRDKDQNGVVDLLFDTDNDGVGDSDTITMANGSSVTATLTPDDIKMGEVEFIATRIVTQGWSDDGTASRSINHLYSYVSPLPNVPDNPVLTRGNIVVGGSATVINPEGHSTIWSGGPVDLGGNNTTSTMIADPSRTTDGANTSQYPNCLGSSTMRPESCVPSATNACPCAVVRSSDRYTPGLDIIEQDASLANLQPDEFFRNFFGFTEEQYRNKSVTIETTAANSDQDAPTGANLAIDEVVWVDATTADAQWNGITVGCSVPGASNAAGMTCDGDLQPSIVIVDGNLRVQGNITFWGLLYVKGNITGSGSVDLRGAMMMGGVNGGLGGGLRVFYNSAVLRSLGDNGQMGGGGGSWRDF